MANSIQSNSIKNNLPGNNADQGEAINVVAYRGNTISKMSVKNIDIDDFIRRQFNEGINKGINSFFHQPISQLAKNINTNSILLSPKDLANYSRKIKDAEGSAKDARHLLDSLRTGNQLPKTPSQRASRKEVMQHYLALQKLGHALQSSDEDFAALLTENTEHASSLNELARHLQERDEKKLPKLLAGGKEFAEDSADLFTLFKESRFDKAKLESILRDKQGLPNLNSEQKRDFLDKVKTQLLILEQDHSKKIYTSLNSFPTAETTSDPNNFIESYSEVVHSDESLGSQIEALCKHYGIKELILVLPEMKQALAEDLESQPRSVDKIKLQHIISNMSILHTAQSALLKVVDFSEEMKRIYTLKIDEKNMLISLVKLVSSSWVSPSQIEHLSKDHNVKEGSPEIYFFTQGVKGIISFFPTHFFQNSEMRISLLVATQEVIEKAIEKEEENIAQTSLSTELIGAK